MHQNKVNPADITIQVEYQQGSWGSQRDAIVTATHTPTGTNFTATDRSAHRARDLAVKGLRNLVNPPEACKSPYCECPPHECLEGKLDQRAQAAEELYSKIVDDTIRDLQQTTKQAKERAVDQWAKEFETAPLATQPPSPYKFYNTLEDHTRTQYLLDKLQEEAAEIIQAVSKIRRFGKDNHHPERTQTNLEELVAELEDLQAIVWALEEIHYLDPKPSTTSVIKKFNTLMG